MKIHEYQAKQILAEYGSPVPQGSVAETVDQAVKIAQEIGTFPVVVKAQVHVGGRGLAFTNQNLRDRVAVINSELRFLLNLTEDPIQVISAGAFKSN